ncbi:Transcription initiation factor IIE subunit beta [Daldinia childiae]|uniref:Transcription initiation factor IIE subunit beta n=1 Tax=Daldinia childiae TaxID=326645 RepID=UPI001448672C|nr:Transcription initiation factor IIE subunit beta [Daldinia childiae]KAF3062188.1 Transcription initiation factor IIE subunit beta [Daldinia childiae]
MSPSKPSNGIKRSAPASSAASPSGANTSKNDNKRQKRDGNAATTNHASTPTPAAVAAAAAAKDFGEHSNTHLSFAVEFLKEKRSPRPLQEILDHLTLQPPPEDQQRAFVHSLKTHSRILFSPAPKSKGSSSQQPEWRTGTYEYRAKFPGVVSKIKLLEYLQQRKDQGGISIKDIKDGWPDCDTAIEELEREHKVMGSIRTRKDTHARIIWPDTPDLHHDVDPEFRVMWFQEALPSVDEMPRKLKALGQKATSEVKNVNLGQKAPPKRKKASRVQKKFENEHMRNIFEQHKRK